MIKDGLVLQDPQLIGGIVLPEYFLTDIYIPWSILTALHCNEYPKAKTTQRFCTLACELYVYYVYFNLSQTNYPILY